MRFFFWVLLGISLTIMSSVHAQSVPQLSTANHHPTFIFGDAWGNGNALHLLVCVDVWCVQQRYITLDNPPASYAGMYSSIITPPDGKPFIAYMVLTPNNTYEIRTIKCGNPACTSGNSMQTISPNAVPERMKLQIQPNSNNTSFVYGDANTGKSYFVQCTIPTCTQLTQNPLGNTLHEAITNQWIYSADGLPIIATREGEILSCNDPACSNPPVISAHPSTAIPQGNAVRITRGRDGKPILSMMRNTPNPNEVELIMSKCTDARCRKRTNTIIGRWIKSVWNEYEHDLKIGGDGLPALTYQNGTQPQLNFLHCANESCSSFNSTTIVASTNSNHVGRHNTFIVGKDGLPIIAHYNMQDLYYILCADIACSTLAQNYTGIIRSNAGMHVSGTLN